MGDGNGLGDFLRARRAQLTPANVGLSDYGARRVAGLRREEVASLAGVSVAYYTRLEQGHDRFPSRGVLDALAGALCLDAGAREHLHVLVRFTRSRSTGRAAEPEHVREELTHFLERHVGAPAMVLGRALDVLAANRLAQALHPSYCPGHNLALDVFLDETAQARYTNPGQVRRNRVSSLRMAAGALPSDARLVEVVGELSNRSAAFRKLWAHMRSARGLLAPSALHIQTSASWNCATASSASRAASAKTSSSTIPSLEHDTPSLSRCSKR